MPRLPLILAIASAILIVVGRLGKRWPVAIAGFVLLAVAAATALPRPRRQPRSRIGRGTGVALLLEPLTRLRSCLP